MRSRLKQWEDNWDLGRVTPPPPLPRRPSKLMELPVFGAWRQTPGDKHSSIARSTLKTVMFVLQDELSSTSSPVSCGQDLTGRCVHEDATVCVCVKQQVGQLWLTHVTRCNDSQETTEEGRRSWKETGKRGGEMDGGLTDWKCLGRTEEETRRWRGGSDWESDAWITWTEVCERWDEGLSVYFYGPNSHRQLLICLRSWAITIWQKPNLIKVKDSDAKLQ